MKTVAAIVNRTCLQRSGIPGLSAATQELKSLQSNGRMGASQFLAASPSAKNIAERCQPLAGGRGAQRRHPRIPWASATTPAGVADPSTGSCPGTPCRVLVSSPVTGGVAVAQPPANGWQASGLRDPRPLPSRWQGPLERRTIRSRLRLELWEEDHVADGFFCRWNRSRSNLGGCQPLAGG